MIRNVFDISKIEKRVAISLTGKTINSLCDSDIVAVAKSKMINEWVSVGFPVASEYPSGTPFEVVLCNHPRVIVLTHSSDGWFFGNGKNLRLGRDISKYRPIGRPRYTIRVNGSERGTEEQHIKKQIKKAKAITNANSGIYVEILDTYGILCCVIVCGMVYY